MSEHQPTENALGTYLRHRRAKLDPTAFGFPSERRRTLGLRREEVAQRANISPTWYAWLEQGRGGAPSADVLDWRDNEVRGAHGEKVKHIRHPVLGPLAFEYSAFAVDGRTDLSMVVYNPATPEDARRIQSLIA
jgi:hypothetical protein